jgi:hypothetical protein
MKSQGDHYLSAVPSTLPQALKPSRKCGSRPILSFVAQATQDAAILVRNSNPVHSIVASFALVLGCKSFQEPMVGRNGHESTMQRQYSVRSDGVRLCVPRVL